MKLAEKPRPARADQMRCTETHNRAYDGLRTYEQRCTLPVGHDGVHFWSWEELAGDVAEPFDLASDPESPRRRDLA